MRAAALGVKAPLLLNGTKKHPATLVYRARSSYGLAGFNGMNLTMREWLDRISDMIGYAPVFLFLAISRLIPFRARIWLAGRMTQVAVTVLPMARRRLAQNFALARPDATKAQNRALALASADVIGRTMAEILFAEEIQDNLLTLTHNGPGLQVLKDSHAAGKGALLVGGHYGQWDAMRMSLKPLGITSGALYRPTNNRYYAPRHAKGLAIAGEPLFPKGQAGLKGMMRYLKQGGVLTFLADQEYNSGISLDFLGVPGRTTMTPAELALRFDMPMIPFFPVRMDAEGRIDIEFAEPIPHTTPLEMMRAFNDLMSDRIRAHPEQWLWLHRRWKSAPKGD